ncbi:hypothetical protein NDU88_002269 [Pleurodeles waltl]|uniref:Uncharacterized protein n=1 Tax=Pleurodeles waltl TaxID=8319 RepID=A0AAV7UV34_PLEWA|nr:hypothetical protein NDU88_002269 [Pleurodeles waltl]
MLTTEGTEKEDTEEGDAEDGGRTGKAPEQTQEEEQKDASPGDNPKGQEGPKERERRHVPGGTWLSQGPGRSGAEIDEAEMLIFIADSLPPLLDPVVAEQLGVEVRVQEVQGAIKEMAGGKVPGTDACP